MVVPTGVRAGRVTALFAGRQSAKETAVSNFTGASVIRLWTRGADLDVGVAKAEATGWMTQALMETAGRYTLPRASQGDLLTIATPAAVEMLLRSNWGVDADFKYKTQVFEWLTFGWVENVLAGAFDYFYRLWDVWIPRISFHAEIEGPVMILASYAGERDDDPIPLDDLGSIVLPAAPMLPGDKNLFPGRKARFVYGTIPTDVEIPLHSISVTIDQGLSAEWDMLRQLPTVFKTGFPGPRVTIELEALVSDQTLRLLTDARDGVKAQAQFIMTAPAPAKTFTITMEEVDFKVEPVGHEGREYVRFRGEGQAHRASNGNFVSITLT